MPDNHRATGHPRPDHHHHPDYTYSADDVSPSQSPLTGRNPNFLDGLLPPYHPPGSPGRIDDDGFYHAGRPVSPPPPNFLDTILNPAGLDHNRFSPFGYRPSPPPLPSPNALPDMPPTTRGNPQGARPARLPNGYVDLTSGPDSPPRRRKRESAEPGPSSKRQRRDDDTASSRDSGAMKIEEVDLTEDKQPVQHVLQKQREDAVKAQTKPEEKPATFNTFNCVICMDIPTDLTATACGHLFCHTCLMEALIAGENRSGPGEPKRSQCPVCRKFISRNKVTDVIPLLLKKGLATQPRKKVVANAVAPKKTYKKPQPAARTSRRRAKPSTYEEV